MTLKEFGTLKPIGKGSFGKVYRAQRLSDGQEYALKEINIKNMSQRERDESLNEVRLLASLTSNPRVIRYYDAFVDHDRLYIVTDFARYGDLGAKVKRHIQRREKMDEDLIWCFFIQTALGVSHLHERNIIHRDLKTANIFLTGGREIRIGDLGVAKFTRGSLAHTQIGTPYYMSPELWRGRAYDRKADIWSLGCVLYELATLRHPFEARDEKGLAEKVMRGVYRPASSSYSRDLHDAIRGMLVVDASKRPTIQQVLDMPCVQRHLASADMTKEHVEQQLQLCFSPLKATIRAPRDLSLLQRRLPQSTYETTNQSSAHPVASAPAPPGRKMQVQESARQDRKAVPENCRLPQVVSPTHRAKPVSYVSKAQYGVRRSFDSDRNYPPRPPLRPSGAANLVAHAAANNYRRRVLAY